MARPSNEEQTFLLESGCEDDVVWVDVEERDDAPPLLVWQGGRLRRQHRPDLLNGVARVVSQRFVEVLRDGGLTGWSTRKIDVSQEFRGLQEYCLLEVTGAAGPPDFCESPRRLVAGDLEVFQGFGFDHWDGADLFSPKGTRFVCLSPRAASVLDGAGLTNVKVTPLEELETFTNEVDGPSESQTLRPGPIASADQLSALDDRLFEQPVRWKVVRHVDRSTLIIELENEPWLVEIHDVKPDGLKVPAGRGTCSGLTWSEDQGVLIVYLGDDFERLQMPQLLVDFRVRADAWEEG